MDKSLAWINFPESWIFYASTLAAMIALAGLDFVGALFAKEWAERGRIPMFILGWISFSILFIVYARILRVAELSTVTIGWIVFLQVGLVLLDVVHYDVQLPRTKWLAIVVMIGLQIYLIAAPNSESTAKSSDLTAPVHATTESPSPSSSQTTSLPSRELKRPSRPLGPNSA